MSKKIKTKPHLHVLPKTAEPKKTVFESMIGRSVSVPVSEDDPESMACILGIRIGIPFRVAGVPV